jgi:HK97 family phage major capsid protein
MSDVNIAEVEVMNKKLDDLSTKFESNYATKKDIEETRDLVKAIGKERAKWEMSQKKHNVFGDMQTAQEFVDYLGNVVETHPRCKGKDPLNIGREITLRKTALDADTTANSGNLGNVSVPTSVSNALSILITEYGMARKFHDVIPLRGNLDLDIATDDAVATYSTNDTTNGSDTNQTLTKVTLSPKQFLAIYRASGKLLYHSALDIASMVGSALVRAAGRLEDDTVWIGDGTSTYASQTGYEDNVSIPMTSVATLSAITIDDLIDLKYKASETSDGDGTYYIARKLRPVLKKLKASTAGTYLIDFQNGQFEIDGTPVQTINRFHDGSTHGDMVVLYGSLRRAGRMGVGRDMAVDLDTSVDFIKAGLVWRLVQDFSFVIPQPTAVAKLRVQAQSGNTLTT